MEYLPPAAVRSVPQAQALALLGALALAALAFAGNAESAAATLGLFAAVLAMGWMAAATAITHVCGARQLVLKAPEMHADFHALSGFRVQVRLGNLGRRWPALFIIARLETVTEGIELKSPPVFLAQLGPRARAPFTWYITVRKRGECELRGVRVRACFPGSLGAHEAHFPFSSRLLALPAAYRLDSRALELLSGRRRAAGRSSSAPASMEDFIGVRDYRPGDNPRNIHLALSLRMPDFPYQLAVREFEDPTMDDVCVVLDTAILPEEAKDPQLLYRHEKSLSFAVALCRLLSERQYFVRFRAVDAASGPIDISIARPTRDLPALEARLARLRPVADHTAVRRLLDQASARGNDAILFVALRDTPAVSRQRRSVFAIPPDVQTSLVREVIGA